MDSLSASPVRGTAPSPSQKPDSGPIYRMATPSTGRYTRSFARSMAVCMVLAGALMLGGCRGIGAENAAAATTPPKSAAPNGAASKPSADDHGHTDGDGHNHSEDDGHNHAAGDGHDHAAGDGHSHAEGDDHDHAEGDDHDHSHESSSDVVPIPPAVRENLGVTFASAEKRRVASTLRVPGRFELRPDATREYRAPLAGRVELLVRQYEHVSTGTPLYRLDSAQWRQMQQDYLNADAEVMATSASLMAAQVASAGGVVAEGVTQSRIKAAESHIASVTAAVQTAEQRLKQVQRLHEIVGGRMGDINEARAQLASLRNELSQAREDRAELEQQRLQLSTDSSSGAFGTTETLRASASARSAEYQAARARRDLALSSLRSIEPDPRELADDDSNSSGPAWTPNAVITIRASADGVVSAIGATAGGFVESSGLVMTVIDPTDLRFRGIALQSDLGRLQSQLPARLLEPGSAPGTGTPIPVVARLSLEADPEHRTLDVVADVNTTATWPRSGVSTNMELFLNSSDPVQVAIPVGAVVQDGLDKIFFRRDASNPDVVHKVKGHFGASDGNWIAVDSDLAPGDQVVMHGVYELKLATSAGQTKGGHVHPDGTFHEGED